MSNFLLSGADSVWESFLDLLLADRVEYTGGLPA